MPADVRALLSAWSSAKFSASDDLSFCVGEGSALDEPYKHPNIHFK